MDVEAYLERINYRDSLSPTAETLKQLQLAHLFAVPFENLSIHSREPIVLNDQALFEKIVRRRRGGFCYELNGLFSGLLRDVGFEVTMLSAGVANAQGTFGPDFDHMTLAVITRENGKSERWLVDVGFGDSFREPLLLDERGEQLQGELSYKLVPDSPFLVMMQREAAGEWKAQYRFTLQPYNYVDYAEMCSFHQTSPSSHFTRARICSRATPEGRLTLSELRLITTIHGDGQTERLLTNEAEYESVLKECFDVVINGSPGINTARKL